MRDISTGIKTLESDLYKKLDGLDSTPIKPTFNRLSGPAKYVAKPSTHGGFYFGGVGCVLGGLGGFLWALKDSLYSDGPDILNKLYSGAWAEAGYHTLYVIAKSALTSTYVAGGAGIVSYVVGSIVTGKVWDSLKSFLSFKKLRGD